MPIYEEDDEDGEAWRGDAPDDDSPDEDPDERDLAKEGSPVRCVHCGKWLHEDAQMCPRCHQWQTDDAHPASKPRWFVVTAVGCVVLIAVFWIGLGWQLRWWPW